MVRENLGPAFITVSLVTFLIAVSSGFFIHQGLTRKAALLLLRTFWGLSISGIPKELLQKGGNLIISNHTSLLDGAILWAALPENTSFAIDRSMTGIWWVKPFLAFASFYKLEPGDAASLRSLAAAVESGKNAVIFPEGRITVTGGLMDIYPGAGAAAERTGAVIIPLHITGGEYSAFGHFRKAAGKQASVLISLGAGAPVKYPENAPREARCSFIRRQCSARQSSLTPRSMIPSGPRRLHSSWRKGSVKAMSLRSGTTDPAAACFISGAWPRLRQIPFMIL